MGEGASPGVSGLTFGGVDILVEAVVELDAVLAAQSPCSRLRPLNRFSKDSACVVFAFFIGMGGKTSGPRPRRINGRTPRGKQNAEPR